MDAEVGVIGVGTMGSMVCWQLADRGVPVIGFEQFAPGHDRGAAGGETRIFRTAYLEGSTYVPVLQEAERLWRLLELRSGRHLLELNGGLMIASADTALTRNVLECIERYGLEATVFDASQAGARWPQHRFDHDDVVVLDHHAGFLRPELAVATAAAAAEAAGAHILRHCRVEALEPDAEGIAIRAGGTHHRVRRAVVTTGPWTPKLFAGTLPIEPRRLVMSWFIAQDPALFSPDRFPIFIRERQGIHISGIPTVDGVGVKVSLNDAYGTVADPDRLACRVTPEELARISTIVAEWLDGLWPEPCRISVYQDGYTQDGHGILGSLPQFPNVLFAVGFSGHGFKMSPAIGRAIADLITRGETSLPINHLAIDREGTGWRVKS
jgi:sarcosine oxidase